MTDTPYSRKALAAFLMSVVLLVSVVTPAVALYDPETDGDVDPVANPDFPQVCSVDVYLLIDRSNSAGTELPSYKSAAKAFVGSLPDDSRVGIITFADPFDDVTPAAFLNQSLTSDKTVVNNTIDAITVAGEETLTNWEAPLLLANDSETADMVILMSDGRPNVYGYPVGEDNNDGSTPYFEPVEAATKAANDLKEKDTRVIGIGYDDDAFSTAAENAFIAISGPDEYVSGDDVQTSDYFLSAGDLSALTSFYTLIGDQFACSIDVQKSNDAGGDTTYSDNINEEVADEGSDVPYQTTVQNTGNIALNLSSYSDVFEGNARAVTLYTDAALTDDVTQAELEAIELLPGESQTFYFDDVAPDDGPFQTSYENVIEFVAVDDDNNQVSDDDPTAFAVNDLQPQLNVVKDVKEANTADAYANTTTVAPGSDVVYRVVITNPADAFDTVDLTDYEDIIEGVESEPALFTDEGLTSSIDLSTVSLAPGDSQTVYFGGSAPAADADEMDDTFNVDGQDNDGNSVSAEDPAGVFTTQVAPELNVVKDVKEANTADAFANTTNVAPSSDVVYRVVITNPADAFETVDLTDYEDIIEGVESEPALFTDEGLTSSIDLTTVSLAPGDSQTVYFGGSAPAADDAELDDTFVVDAVDDDSQTVSAEDPAGVFTTQVAPLLGVVKDVKEANTADTFANTTTVAPGVDIVYRVVITNPAGAFETVDLTDYEDVIEGVESEPALYTDEALTSSIDLTTVSLAPGESQTVYFGGSAPAADDAELDDTFVVDAVDDDSQTVSAEDPAGVFTTQVAPELNVVKDVKEANTDDAYANTTTVAPGSDVVYRVVITNPADAFETVDLTDYEDVIEGVESEPALYTDEALTSSIDLTTISLAPGESVTVYFGGSAPAADADEMDDTFVVDAVDDDSQTVTAEDPAGVFTLAIAPELNVTKYVDANGDMIFADDTEEADNPLDDVVFKVVISNPADAFETVDLTDYDDVVDGGSPTMPALYSDYALTSSVDLTTVSLAPGESVTVYFGSIAPAESGASTTDVFTVDGEDDDSQTVSASDDATVTTPDAEGICARTPGFWSTHNGDYATGNNFDAVGPLLPVTLGDGTGTSVVVDSDDVANDIFEAQLTADSHKSNGITKLYIHLLAAELNVGNGATVPTDVALAIERSDEILTMYDESDWDDIKKNDKELAQEIDDLKNLLDRYNNGHFDGEDCIGDWWKEDSSSEEPVDQPVSIESSSVESVEADEADEADDSDSGRPDKPGAHGRANAAQAHA